VIDLTDFLKQRMREYCIGTISSGFRRTTHSLPFQIIFTQ
jgi:hypothetical protein